MPIDAVGCHESVLCMRDCEAGYEKRAGEAIGLAGFVLAPSPPKRGEGEDQVSSVRPGTATAGTGRCESHVRLAGIRFCVEFSACSQVTSLPV